jgi:hypothetical protein
MANVVYRGPQRVLANSSMKGPDIQGDANDLLAWLVDHKARHPDAWEIATLHAEVPSFSTTQLNDAIALLERRAFIVATRYLGTAPYDVGLVELTIDGKVEGIRLNREGEERRKYGQPTIGAAGPAPSLARASVVVNQMIVNSIIGAVAAGPAASAHGTVVQDAAEESAQPLRQQLERLSQRADDTNIAAYHRTLEEFVHVRYDGTRVADLRRNPLPKALVMDAFLNSRLDELQDAIQEANSRADTWRALGADESAIRRAASQAAIRVKTAARLALDQVGRLLGSP